jgi:hypothetical protein
MRRVRGLLVDIERRDEVPMGSPISAPTRALLRAVLAQALADAVEPSTTGLTLQMRRVVQADALDWLRGRDVPIGRGFHVETCCDLLGVDPRTVLAAVLGEHAIDRAALREAPRATPRRITAAG